MDNHEVNHSFPKGVSRYCTDFSHSEVKSRSVSGDLRICTRNTRQSKIEASKAFEKLNLIIKKNFYNINLIINLISLRDNT